MARQLYLSLINEINILHFITVYQIP